jgi:pimeloyl-ACP methyl ester carboxylesterase
VLSVVTLLAIAWLACTTSATAADAWFSSNGVRLHYSIDGAGPPVILLHGFGGNSNLNWRLPGMTARLAKTRQVIALDSRGHGKSGKPRGISAYGLEQVEDVHRLMDYLHLQQADLVGYSMGGMEVMKFITLHPERVHAAVVGGMGWLKPFVAMLAFRPPAEKHGPLADCWGAMRSLAVPRPAFDAIKIPLEVVVGADDRAVRRLYVAPLHVERPEIPIVLIPDSNHFTCIGKPQFIDAVATFLDKRGLHR